MVRGLDAFASEALRFAIGVGELCRHRNVFIRRVDDVIEDAHDFVVCLRPSLSDRLTGKRDDR